MSQSDKNRTTVEIHNRLYTIKGDEPAHHIRMVASLVDQQMREMKETNPGLDTAKLAVLTAVNTMNDYVKLKEEYMEVIDSKRKDEDRLNND
ncbi:MULTISPECIES: cell division protein ZapA [Pontibacillus]|uniref:Cell division protein ZapA n=1 Tax=Pontibacillus marinus BH030004 = DSM 16465 TaxID=1385511 RepID=A0A0A5HMG5_9BACI|nr:MULTISPECIES: cell division protein ZapA [Pontibacillus]KGX84822.1 cell division protein ZapA [Pontibacillus marinus BH030004 = DSM 16465]QHE53195.1 cell division protein ZapA [Pontibacillus sp. HMF3514]